MSSLVRYKPGSDWLARICLIPPVNHQEALLLSEVEAIKARIRALPPQDFACLREWFHQFENERWDQQIADDYKAGKLNHLIEKARTELAQGKAPEL